MMNHSTIFFDLDGTLRFNEPPAIQTFHRLASEMGIPSNPEKRREAERWNYVYWASSDELLEDLERFGDWEGNGAFWANHARRHLVQLGAAEDIAEASGQTITQRMFSEYQPEVYVPEDVLPTLHFLRRHGYGLGIVSNRPRSIEGIVTELGLSEAIDFSLAAGEVDFWKPDPRLLLRAAQIANVEPKNAIYVGDSLYADVACASAAEMLPFLVDPVGLFPEASCPVIAAIGELPEILMMSGQTYTPRVESSLKKAGGKSRTQDM